ncbi:MAG TPA: hypothetical protein VE994_17775 [Terriglobales bacterium]|nr:hypothetical protein [Terriglobales bacterium]
MESDGFLAQMPPSFLKLTIVSIDPTKVAVDGTVKLILELQNTGPDTIRIPWNTEEKSYDSLVKADDEHFFADLDVRISDREASREPEELASAKEVKGRLFAVKGDNSSFQEIAPGQWVTLITTANLECWPAYSGICKQVEHGGQFWLSAVWDENVLSVSHEPCYVGTQQLPVRFAISDPVLITILADEDDD